MTTSNSKKIFFFLYIVLISVTAAQNKVEIDTLKAFEFSLPQEVIQYQLNTHPYLLEPENINLSPADLNDSTSVWLRTRMMIGSFTNRTNEFESSAAKMTDPMFSDYLDSQKLATLRAILGSVQVGAVAYLAYKHIKKYGFLKK